MVREINSASTNSLLNAALTKGITDVSSDNLKAAENAQQPSLLDFIDNSQISNRAKRLNEAYKFGKLAQTIELPTNDRVAYLQAAVANQGIDGVADSYNLEDLAKSILNSPSGAFLR